MNSTKESLSFRSRILITSGAIGLVLVLFFPMWRIELDAPQYPEGLTLQIYPGKLGGNVDIINGLNHYIGMKTLHAEDFVEFTVLPYFIGGFALFCLLVVFINRKQGLSVLFFAFLSFCLIAMADFWRWEYNYGHDLDPNAAIQVPGMAYQPPLIGFKQLLNFGAFSIPDTGGWIFAGVGLLLLLAYLNERGIFRRLSQKTATGVGILMVSSTLIASCSAGPEPIRPGKDACDFCKMTIAEEKFAAEIVTTKGKVLKFDDLSCGLRHISKGKISEADVREFYVSDFMGSGLIPAASAFYFSSPDWRSPMNGNIAAFKSESDMRSMTSMMQGKAMTWEEVRNTY